MNTMLYAASHQENADTKPTMRRAGVQLSNLEKTLQAGIILNFLAGLPEEQTHTLIAKYRNPHAVCNCTNLCCSGFKKDADWKRSIEKLGEYLHKWQNDQRLQGIEGTFKTSPPLMVRLLHKSFDTKFRLSQLDIAENVGVDPRTVAAHGKYIQAKLDDWCSDGLTGMDLILVDQGIVGALE